MKNFYRIVLLIIFLSLFCYLLIGLSPILSKIFISPSVVTFSVIPTQTLIKTTNNVSCHINGLLPDPSCTPGAIDARVTQDNIDQTICVNGYTKTVRPPVSYTNKLKIQQIIAYEYSDNNPRDYEEDHLISLELGGSPDNPKNLWPEPGASPNPKDKIENLCHEKVCSGQITLAQAQYEIATNWPTACQ